MSPDSGYITIEAQVPMVQGVSEQVNDIVLARAIAQAVRDIPWVVDMSSGPFNVEATYGSGEERVIGVVLRHAALGPLFVEVHVVVAETALLEVSGTASLSDTSFNSDEVPLLARLANQARAAVYHTIFDMDLLVPIVVDVAIDDIQ